MAATGRRQTGGKQARTARNSRRVSRDKYAKSPLSSRTPTACQAMRAGQRPARTDAHGQPAAAGARTW